MSVFIELRGSKLHQNPGLSDRHARAELLLCLSLLFVVKSVPVAQPPCLFDPTSSGSSRPDNEPTKCMVGEGWRGTVAIGAAPAIALAIMLL